VLELVIAENACPAGQFREIPQPACIGKSVVAAEEEHLTNAVFEPVF
jgi:hypothetical protein